LRAIDWVDGKICIIDQTRLPTEEPVLLLETVEEVAEAISSLRVRGAPALGVAGGSGPPSRRDGRERTIGATHETSP
jgi:methylthioribose-1-phosphate isomerase